MNPRNPGTDPLGQVPDHAGILAEAVRDDQPFAEFVVGLPDQAQ
jgi:hypothetical protein